MTGNPLSGLPLRGNHSRKQIMKSLRETGDYGVELRKKAGQHLADLRSKSGLTQKEVATLLGYGYPSQYGDHEQGRVALPTRLWLTFAEAVKASPQEVGKMLLRHYDPIASAIIVGSSIKVVKDTILHLDDARDIVKASSTKETEARDRRKLRNRKTAKKPT